MLYQFSASSRAQGWVAVEEVRDDRVPDGSGTGGVCKGGSLRGARGIRSSVECDIVLTSVQVLERKFKITSLGDLLLNLEWLLCSVSLC